jgi:hypothetical protein
MNGSFSLSILAGLIVGGILAGFTILIVQPYTRLLADIEIENLFAEGEFDEDVFNLHLICKCNQSIFCSFIVRE